MSKICRIVIKDEVYSHISGLSNSDFEFLFKKMAKMVEGAIWSPAYKMGRWDGRIPFLSQEGRIYTRLLDHISPYLDNWGYEIDIVDLRRPVEIIEQRIDKDWFLRKEGMPFKVELRPYQIDAINACLENQSGFILAATGAGKCLHGDTVLNTFWKVGDRFTDTKITYEELFSFFEDEGCVFDINVPVDIRKFNLYLPSPNGNSHVVAAIKKQDILYEVSGYDSKVDRCVTVKCAAGHLFIDENGETIAADKLLPGQMIQGDTCLFEIKSANNTGINETFYDVSIDNASHTYYDAVGVLHHNTWMVTGLVDILALHDMRSIVIVPSDDLVKQTVATLRQGQIDVGTYSGSSKDIHHAVVVATWQALQNNPTIVSELNTPFVSAWTQRPGPKTGVHGDTSITTPQGTKPLSTVEVGDLIECFDTESNTAVFKPIKRINMFIANTDDVFELTLDDGRVLKVTDNTMLETDSGWKRVCDIQDSDVVI